jgi:hypothetical protein
MFDEDGNQDTNQETNDDRMLDEALLGRSAAAPPPGFTAAVLQRVAAEPRRASVTVPRWLTALSAWCDPVVAGIVLAALGTVLAIDVRSFVVWVNQELAAPNPLVVAVAALFLSGLWFTTTAETDEDA